jgi:hypothetical protein
VVGIGQDRVKAPACSLNWRFCYISSTEKYIFHLIIEGVLMATVSSAAIPSHVPHDLVLPFPLVLGATTTEDPFERMIPDIHRGPGS